MSDETSRQAVQDPSPIFRLVRATRRVLRTSWVATGLGLTAGLLLSALVVVALLDLVAPARPEVTLFDGLGLRLSVPGALVRLLGLLLVVVPAAWAFLTGVVRPLCRRLSNGHVARRIETHLPGIHNRLVSCLDLADNPNGRRSSPAFYSRLVQEALERSRSFRPGTVVDRLSLRRAAVFAGGAVLAFFLALVLFADRLPTALARIFRPFADIPPVGAVAYDVKPGDARVLRGEDIPFLVTVARGEPKKLSLELRGAADQRPLLYDLEKEGTDWTFTLSSKLPAGFEDGFRYRVHGGGTWSPEYRVALVERPAIVDYHAVLHYPEYMALPEPRVGPERTLEITGPEGSRVEVIVKAEGNVTEGEVQFLEPRRRQVEVRDRPERLWVDGRVPPGAKVEGRWEWDEKQHQKPTHTEPPAVGVHGHWFYDTPAGFPLRAGECLFADVYIVPGQEPETVMLEWHDGQGWEHRAFWGQDRIALGQPGTPSRHRAGPLPPAGRWVRLEVPAAEVGLEGKVLRGLSFKLSGGQCSWHQAGVLGPATVEKLELAVVRTFPVQPTGDNVWSGSFPLHRQGLYRVELRNELGYPNQPMKEGKFLAVVDQPPQLVLERPGSDLVLSTPTRVPLVLAAYDDFGLAEVVVRTQLNGQGDFDSRPVKKYAKPLRTDSVVAGLDLAALKLKVGDSLRYRAEARDRKGQVTKTPEFTVRIAADPNAADQQLAALEKGEDPFREKLIKLIAEQAKVRDTVEKVAAQYAKLDATIKTADAEARAQQKAAAEADPKKPPPPLPPLKLDPESEKQLQALRKELAELAAKEQQNAALGQQASADLARLADQAANLKMLPRELAEEMRRMQQLFERTAVGSLKDLAAQMQRGGTPNQTPPDLNELKGKTDRLQQDLEALRQMQEAVANARRNLRDEADAAIAQLKHDIERLKSGMTARDLEELRKFLAALQGDLKDMEGKQGELLSDARKVSDQLLPAVEKKQESLDTQLEELLRKAKELQESERLQRMKNRRDPSFPDAPYTPEGDEKPERPREQDTNDPLPTKKDAQGGPEKPKDATAREKNKPEEDEDERKFMPALGGPKPKVDPRFANRMRPVERKKDATAAEKREALAEHQEQSLQDLQMAQQSLKSDEQTLDNLLQRLQQAMRPNANQQQQPPNSPGQQQSPDLAQQLAQLLQSPTMRQAQAMAQRMQQMRNAPRQQPGRPQGPPTSPNLSGAPVAGGPLDAELSKLDLATRDTLMKMQPRLREELLQGMREEGPEGYRKFIQDYFKRLTETPQK